MQYRTNPKNGQPLSALGYGCMRFTKKGGAIDQEKANRELKRALELGVNYFDTAYIYPGSEEALGKFIETYHCRDQLCIATKLPQYRVRKTEDFDAFFNEELKRLKTDYVDYYLMHMMNDAQSFERLCKLGLKEWIAAKKASGAIRNVGFSFHGGTLQFKSLIDAWDWDFCQIQFNYMDEHAQAGIDGLNYAHEKGLPVIIMEPLRGGRLVNRLPEEAKKIFAGYRVKRTPAQWAFRWLWDQKEVTCVLSGMNSDEMVRDNIETASSVSAGELTGEDQEMLRRVVGAINAKVKVGCTGCSYCMPCPKSVDIPGAFAAYNRRHTEGKFWGTVDYVICTALRKTSTAASNCIGCGKCEQHCPQHINIREQLADVRREFETPVYRAVRVVAGKIVRF